MPELKEYAKYIANQSDGKAFLVIESDGSLYEVKQEDEYNQYFMVYVGEQREDHRANWEWFYVRKDLDKILWYNLPEDQSYSLSEWRDSSNYKSRQYTLNQGN